MLNLDSFSLYTRAGFVPRRAFQDMLVGVPQEGLGRRFAGAEHVRPAKIEDVSAAAALEREIAGISREKDYRYFIDNRDGLWEMFVYDGPNGVEGFLAGLKHPGLPLVGPGVARTEEQAAALLARVLDGFRGGRRCAWCRPTVPTLSRTFTRSARRTANCTFRRFAARSSRFAGY